jgi:1,2-diacylglycerol 3-alpha-glucosyltransferase
MRIGMMADVYKPHVSGITNYIALNKAYLEQEGHEVFVFTFGGEHYVDEESNIIRSVGMHLLDTGYFLSLRYSKSARRLLQTMDVVHVHHPFLSGSLAIRYCKSYNIPIVFTNHTRYDLYAQAYLPALPEVVGETALQAYLPTFCRLVDLVISPSPGMREVLLKFGVDVPIEVVPNGVDVRPFLQDIQPRDRSEFGFSPQDVVLIYTGRLGPEKNLPFLLRSFGGAVQAYDNLGLLLVGDGIERDNLQDRVRVMGIQDRVHFTGMVPYAELPGYLAMADAFVTASVTEVHPLSLIEAMAAGLPALGIQSPGIGDTIVDGETGLLVAEEDLAAYTAKLIRLVTFHEPRRQMGEQARLASQAYAIECTTRMMLEQYQNVVERVAKRRIGVQARLRRFMENFR